VVRLSMFNLSKMGGPDDGMLSGQHKKCQGHQFVCMGGMEYVKSQRISLPFNICEAIEGH
jgi:hypothetical protein